jgi:hypothetical protein
LNYENGTLYIRQRGYNADVYEFMTGNVIATEHNRTMDELVTRVMVVGKESKEGRAPVVATLDGDLSFGLLQDIVQKESAKSLADAQKDAETMLKDRGQPKDTVRVTAPDIPFLRRGWKIKIRAGDLDDYYFVLGVSHEAGGATMTMEVERVV